MTMSRPVVAGFVLLAMLLVGCVVAIAVLAVRLNDKTNETLGKEKAGTDHAFVNNTVHDLGLDVVDFELGLGSGAGSRYYLRGKHMTYDELVTEAPYNLPPENRVDLRTLYWHKFFRNHHLKAINRQSDGNYVLTFQVTETKAGITTEIKSRPPMKMCAKKVLLGIPRIALEHLDWEGLRQETVLDYIKNDVSEVQAAKMYFGYDNAWWRNLDKAASHAISMTPLRQTYDFAVSKTTSKGVLNPSYNYGDNRIWREAMKFGERVPGVGDHSIAMTNVSVYLARKYLAEVFNITLDDVPEPSFAVMSIWDQYPIGTAWYLWAPGYKRAEVESRMIKPSANDDVYITSNVFSSTGRSGWIQGGMEMVEKVLKHLE